MRNLFSVRILLSTISFALALPALAAEPLTHCEQPLGWRIGQIDPHFEVTAQQLESETRQAAELWNQAAGRTVLTRDEQNGFPVNLIHDHRHQRAMEVTRLQEQVGRLEAELEQRQQTLEADRTRQQQRRDNYQQELARYHADLQRHNQAVEAANRNRPDAGTIERIRQQTSELEQRRQELANRQQALQRHQQALQQHIDTYNDLVERFNARARELTRASRLASADSGEYRADITRDRRGNMVSIQREIDVYFFFDRRDLRWTLAHELGHALGIGHVEHPDAVMHAAYLADTEGTAPALHAEDIRALRALCD